MDAPSAPGLQTYLYCLSGPDCLPAVQALAAQAACGVDERYPVGALQDDGMVAVVGDVDGGDFCDRNLQALQWVAPRAFRHEAVVERVMDAAPVLPVKFGTLFRSRATLQHFLERHRQGLAQGLEQLRGKSEWSVKGYLREEHARRQAAESEPAIQCRLAALPAAPGARYLQRRQLDGAIDAALRRRVVQWADELRRQLALHAEAAADLRCHGAAVTGRPDPMVFNASFLVGHAALPRFRAALAQQQPALAAGGLMLELRGPWPPYNFCPALPREQADMDAGP